MTHRGINVLFQDVDLVWFRDPFPYFKAYRQKAMVKSKMSGSYAEAFFSDDGQRSLRYSPFFANSGFYYMIGGKKSGRSPLPLLSLSLSLLTRCNVPCIDPI